MALVRCILGKFLGVVCHCFPPRLDVPTFAARCRNDARVPSSERWNYGRERLSGNFAYMASIHAIRDLLHAATLRHDIYIYIYIFTHTHTHIYIHTHTDTHRHTHTHTHNRAPLIRHNWDGEPSGLAENPDNWIFV